MKFLKSLLISIYPILILLLVLLNLGKCNPKTDPEVKNIKKEKVKAPSDSSLIKQAKKTGESGDLKVTLLWDFYADIDLHIKQPNNRTISYQFKKDDSTGGFLDVDNTVGGSGAAENIYWRNPRAGAYMISLNYYNGSDSGICTVIVFQKGKAPQTYKVEMSRIKETKKIADIVI